MTHACSDSGAWSLALALHLLAIAADPARLQHECGKSSGLDESDLLRAAKQFPVKVKAITLQRKRRLQLSVPSLVAMKTGGFAVVGRVTTEGVLLQEPMGRAPRFVTLDDLASLTTGRAILIAKCGSVSDLGRQFDLNWFIDAAWKYRRILGEVLLASLIIQLFALATPLIFQAVIDKVLVHRGISTLEVMVSGLALIAVCDALLSGLRNYLFAHTSNRIDVELGARTFRHLLQLPLSYFETRRVGDSVARVRELETIRQFITSSTITLVLDLFFCSIFISVMFLYSSMLSWLVVATLPIYALLSLATTPGFRRKLNEKFRRGAENQAFLVESVTGIETIKAMAVEPQMQRQWEDQLASYVGASFSASQLGNWTSQAANLLNKSVSAIILFVGSGLVITNKMTVGELVAFNMMSGQVNGPVLRLVQVWQDCHQVRLSVDRLGDILNTPAELRIASGQTSQTRISGEIELERVTFRYRVNEKPILCDVSLKIPAGQVVGIVGPSGSGKSTITKLIQRLYLPESGRLLVDGMDVAIIDPTLLRRQIGIVLQENLLFNRSVRENIALADPATPFDQIVAAAKMAGAHDFICDLGLGYDTQIGERGVSLSGGQRQRIAIARALIGDPRILIFDEATSALDYESERLIQTNMREICRGRTVLIVAHRLSTVRHSDRILTIDDGKIVEDGVHDQLVASGGRYASLHKIQSALRA
ncbi:MAG: type I secretion system permease/ATPase [Candidatus Pacebacteria bacterium]|nr:type I secretion system permease/ATPase [Candidatus Paceibacterota bacterium]